MSDFKEKEKDETLIAMLTRLHGKEYAEQCQLNVIFNRGTNCIHANDAKLTHELIPLGSEIMADSLSDRDDIYLPLEHCFNMQFPGCQICGCTWKQNIAGCRLVRPLKGNQKRTLREWLTHLYGKWYAESCKLEYKFSVVESDMCIHPLRVRNSVEYRAYQAKRASLYSDTCFRAIPLDLPVAILWGRDFLALAELDSFEKQKIQISKACDEPTCKNVITREIISCRLVRPE